MSEEKSQQQQQSSIVNDPAKATHCPGDKTTTGTRKRTRATADQLAVLEDTFSVNVSPNSRLRKQLAERLKMSDRSIQIWFQNRRAKVRQMAKRTRMQMHQATLRQQLYHPYQQPLIPSFHHPHQQRIAVPPRALSVDALTPSSMSIYASATGPAAPSLAPPPSFLSCTSSSISAAEFWSRQSMPPCVNDLMNFPDSLHHQQISPSPSPHADLLQSISSSSSSSSSFVNLIQLPESGPTAMLSHQPHTPAATPPSGLSKASAGTKNRRKKEKIMR